MVKMIIADANADLFDANEKVGAIVGSLNGRAWAVMEAAVVETGAVVMVVAQEEVMAATAVAVQQENYSGDAF